MIQKYSFHINRPGITSKEDCRSLDIDHGQHGLNLSVGTKKRHDIIEVGEVSTTITLSKNQVGLLIATLQEIHSAMG